MKPMGGSELMYYTMSSMVQPGWEKDINLILYVRAVGLCRLHYKNYWALALNINSIYRRRYARIYAIQRLLVCCV